MIHGDMVCYLSGLQWNDKNRILSSQICERGPPRVWMRSYPFRFSGRVRIKLYLTEEEGDRIYEIQ